MKKGNISLQFQSRTLTIKWDITIKVNFDFRQFCDQMEKQFDRILASCCKDCNSCIKELVFQTLLFYFYAGFYSYDSCTLTLSIYICSMNL